MGDAELRGTCQCNYCPKPIDPQNEKVIHECTLSDGTPCSPCTRQIKLRADIEEARKVLDKLIAEEHQARIDVNHSHDPLNRFPPEIISHIFCFTVPEFQLQEEKKCPPSEPGALVLGGVCHMWREIAWSTPQLWSTIMLSCVHYPPTQNMNDVVEKWLQRSQELPLSIRLYLSNTSLFHWEDDCARAAETVCLIDLFIEHFSRWQDLSVQSDSFRLFNPELYWTGRDNESRPRNAPYPLRLKTLQLLCHHRETREPRFFLDFAKPQPERVILSGFPALENVGVSWNDATNITITDFQLADYIQLLQVTPKLVNLTINNLVGPLNPPVPNPPLIRHNIRTFCISTGMGIETILDGIELPSLEKLSILGIEKKFIRGPFHSIIHFLERSSCPLTSFILRNGACEDEDILNLLNALPSTIKTLELDVRNPNHSRYSDIKLPAVVFSHLSRISTSTNRAPRAGSELLPNLENFTYFIFETGTRIPWDLFPSIVRPVSGRKRPLKNLSIRGRTTPVSRSDSPIELKARTDIHDDVIRDLISLQEDGVELYLLTGLVTRESLHERLLELELLEAAADISEPEAL